MATAVAPTDTLDQKRLLRVLSDYRRGDFSARMPGDRTGMAGKICDALNDAIVHGVRSRGRSVPSSTRVDGRFAIRPCFINPRSTLADADALVDEVLAVGQGLSAAGLAGEPM